METLKQELIEISEIAKEIFSLSENEDVMLTELNKLHVSNNKKHLEELNEEYKGMTKEYPISYFRKIVFNRIKNGEELTKEFIEEKKKELQKSDKTFSSFKNDRLLMPMLITQESVERITKFMEAVRNKLEEEINQFSELKYKMLIYEKTKCTFAYNILIRFYNKSYSSVAGKKRLLFEVRPNGNLIYGLANTTGTTSGLPEISLNDFDFDKMIQNFRDNIDVILNDTPENTNNSQKEHLDSIENDEDENKKGAITESKVETNYPLNQILYGPPGTGKTYSTVLLASNIIGSLEGREFSESEYMNALKLYRKSLGDQIEFITFHQNYSYEDFVQGLRPDLDNSDSSLQFSKSDGIFKIIADRAKQNLLDSQNDISKLSKEEIFYKGIEAFSQEISDTEDEELFKINDSVYINAIDKDAFRFKWYNSLHHPNTLRMKYSDLFVYYTKEIKTRKDALIHREELSPLSVSHSTYYLIVNNEINKIIKRINAEELKPVNIKKKRYVLIIDEINRANISRVFGELITLIEPEKRIGNSYSMEVKLPSGDKFSIPNNLYIIGTMNTADKSIALLDIALRRRFEFVSMYPKYNIKEIKEVDFLRELNLRIIETRGHDYQIGHSYFMGEEFNFLHVMNSKVIPLMQDYFMNNYKEVIKIISETLNLIYNDKYKIAENIFPLQIVENENNQSI